MKELLKKYFGFDSFRPGQEELIQKLMNKEDVLGIMPTGGGKSLCYQLPAMAMTGVTIVVSPLISLMKDQVDAANQLGLPATFINSTLTSQETTERFRALNQGKYKLLYVAPERFIMPDFLSMLRQLSVAAIAVDEAHCLSQWGHDFRPSYLQMAGTLNMWNDRPPLIALTATATVAVAKDIKTQLNIPANNQVQTGFARENLTFQVIKDQKKEQYILEYLKMNKGQSGIIYAATRKEVERLYNLYSKLGFSVGKYHGGLTEKQRTQMQEDFLYDRLPCMIATNAFGMGINKSNVRFVIHAQMPGTIEAYYQEAGRAGRDGLASEAILLFAPQDVQIQKFFIQQSQRTDDQKIIEYEKLKAMTKYVHIESCLQQYIVHYFGEKIVPCKKCGNCLDDRLIEDVTRTAQMILSCLKRMGETYGKQMVAKVLAGSKEQKVLQGHFEQLSTYGLMKGQSQKDIVQFIDHLISEGCIVSLPGEYPVLQVTSEGIAVLKGQQKVYRKAPKAVERLIEDDELFEVFRLLRTDLAEDAGVPPYVIFSDSTLKEMSQVQPKNRVELLQIKGIGQNKLDKYGELFLDAIKKYAEKTVD
ncbi:MAG: DNA helicase RecQ [Enterococcus sp.]